MAANQWAQGASSSGSLAHMCVDGGAQLAACVLLCYALQKPVAGKSKPWP